MSKRTVTTAFRSVAHTTGSATSVLTSASSRHQKLVMTSTEVYAYELDISTAKAGDQFIIDVTVGALAGDVEIYNGVGGGLIGFLSSLTIARHVVYSVVFNGTAWETTVIGDGNTEGEADYTGLQVNNSSSQAGIGPEKANFDHSHSHGNRSGGTLHSAATTSTNGFQSAADKKKQDDGGGVYLRSLTGLSATIAAAYTDMVDGATTDVPITASTTNLIEVHIRGYRKVSGNGEGGPATYREVMSGTFRATVTRDATDPTTPSVVIEPTAGDTVWVVQTTASKTVKMKPVGVSGGFKLQVIQDEATTAIYNAILSAISGSLNISATINVYPVATIA
jgi:hypothetical protein